MRRLTAVGLQFITHFTERYSYVDSARMALEGGCRWVQLRMKGAGEEELVEAAREVRALCDRYGATFIIDDHAGLVTATGADGVHLGRNDMPVAEARRLLGPDAIIGGTANTFDDVLAHTEAGADYIGCGPFRFTTTKEKLSPVLGTEGYRRIVGRMREAGITLPMVAIGGIGLDDLPQIMDTGVAGIALSGSVLRADDPAAEMRRIADELQRYGRMPQECGRDRER